MYHDTLRRMQLRLAARRPEPSDTEIADAVDQAEQDRRNRAHLLEQARALATLPEAWRRFYQPQQEAADRALTDWLGGRQARLDEGIEEES